jgi:hypothetical protein
MDYSPGKDSIMKKCDAVEILKACSPIYNKLYHRVAYDLNELDVVYLDKLKEVWQAGFIEQSEVLEEANFNITKVAFLIGYVTNEARVNCD